MLIPSYQGVYAKPLQTLGVPGNQGDKQPQSSALVYGQQSPHSQAPVTVYTILIWESERGPVGVGTTQEEQSGRPDPRAPPLHMHC